MVPRQISEIFSPLRPSLRYFMRHQSDRGRQILNAANRNSVFSGLASGEGPQETREQPICGEPFTPRDHLAARFGEGVAVHAISRNDHSLQAPVQQPVEYAGDAFANL